MRKTVPALVAIGLVVLGTGCSGLVELLEPVATSVPAELDRETVVAGLKEALRVGSGRAVDRTAVLDGYLGNELIRIVMPDELDSMARALRRIGLGRQVGELETAMNRAAEEAAGEARDVLTEQVRALTFADAMSILRGGPTAATDYFHERTADDVRARFHPIVIAKMDAVGLSRLYGDLAQTYNQLPFVSRPAVDLDEYVTDQALSGLFRVLGEEEARIREDPVARTTQLLKKVFGR